MIFSIDYWYFQLITDIFNWLLIFSVDYLWYFQLITINIFNWLLMLFLVDYWYFQLITDIFSRLLVGVICKEKVWGGGGGGTIGL